MRARQVGGSGVEQCLQIRRPASLVDGFRPSSRVSARWGAALPEPNSRVGQRDTAFDGPKVRAGRRVAVESVDRGRRAESVGGFWCSISCAPLQGAHALTKCGAIATSDTIRLTIGASNRVRPSRIDTRDEGSCRTAIEQTDAFTTGLLLAPSTTARAHGA